MIQEVPEEHVKSEEQQDQCSICFVACDKPVRCKGPCHKLFCLQCAANAKCSNDRCPQRCSSPFLVQHVVRPLKCPFNRKQCSLMIKDEEELASHYLSCPYISPENKQQMINKDNYLCKEGHKLTFLPKDALRILYGDYWINDARVDCVGCNNWLLCRNICMTCSIREKLSLYCHQCRVTPCTKTKCPLGHKLKERKKPGKSRFCDLCDSPAGLMGDKVFGFCQCDFDLCQSCQAQQSQKNAKVPLRWDGKKLWSLSMIGDNDSGDSSWVQ